MKAQITSEQSLGSFEQPALFRKSIPL